MYKKIWGTATTHEMRHGISQEKRERKDTLENTQAMAIETRVQLHATCHIFSKAVNDFFSWGKIHVNT